MQKVDKIRNATNEFDYYFSFVKIWGDTLSVAWNKKKEHLFGKYRVKSVSLSILSKCTHKKA